MADEFAEYKCPICDSTNINTTLGICRDCGYNDSMDKKFGYVITCNATTNGNCTVVTPYGNITDGQTCTVPFGTKIIITAVPDATYQFSAWAGGSASLLSGNPVSIIVQQDITFSATMVSQKKITFGAITNGNATVNGVAVDVGGEALYFDADTELALVAIPDDTYIFKTWAGTGWSAANNVTNPITLTLSANQTVALAFQALTPSSYTIYTDGDDEAVKIQEYSADGKNVTIKYTPSSGKVVETVYVCDVSDLDAILKPTVTANAFVADMEEANDYVILVIFGTA